MDDATLVFINVCMLVIAAGLAILAWRLSAELAKQMKRLSSAKVASDEREQVLVAMSRVTIVCVCTMLFVLIAGAIAVQMIMYGDNDVYYRLHAVYLHLAVYGAGGGAFYVAITYLLTTLARLYSARKEVARLRVAYPTSQVIREVSKGLAVTRLDSAVAGVIVIGMVVSGVFLLSMLFAAANADMECVLVFDPNSECNLGFNS